MDDDELDPVKIGTQFGWSQAQMDALAACLREQKPFVTADAQQLSAERSNRRREGKRLRERQHSGA
jgi:hypothetical protein